MIICDIFDALSSADRPYRKAVTVDRALEILEVSVLNEELDPELFRIFVESRIFEPPLLYEMCSGCDLTHRAD